MRKKGREKKKSRFKKREKVCFREGEISGERRKNKREKVIRNGE